MPAQKPKQSIYFRSLPALLTGLLITPCLTTNPVLAQTVPAQVQTQEQAQSYRIPAGPLSQVLSRFAADAGIILTANAELTDGLRSDGLNGRYSVRDALQQLLAGSGLVMRYTGDNSVTIELAQQDGAFILRSVQVSAASIRGDGLTEAYAGGQVARGGRVGLLGDKDFMETPFNTISYTDKLIEDSQAQDITSVIAATDPSVFATGLTGTIAENYSIRGFGSSISDVTVDGLYGVSPYYRTSPEMFERIEVLKGPSALLNGMPPGGSVGGSVNLVPKRAGDEPLTRLAATYMSDSLFGGHVDVGRRFGENQQFGVRFNGVSRDGEGAVDHQNKEARLSSLGLDWRGDRARLSTDLYASKDRVDGLNRGINLVDDLSVPKPPEPETLLNPGWAFFDTEDKGAMVRGELDLSDQLMAYAAMGTSKTEYKTTGAFLIQVFNEEGDYRTNLADLAFELEKESGEVGLKGEFLTGGIGHEWSLSATHYTHTDRQNGRRNVLAEDWITNIYNPVWGPSTSFNAPPISKTELRLTSYGLADTLSFAQDRVQLTLGIRRQEVVSDTFSVTTGARTARYDESATTPAAALLFKATDHISVYGNYIEGLSQGVTAPLTAANAGEVFPPYKTKQKEVGLKFDFGEFAHTVSLYEINRPSSYTDPVTNIFSFGGEQRNRGVEWSFYGSPRRGVRLMGGIAYMDPKLTKTEGGVNQGNMATGVPKLQAKLGAEWDIPTAQGLTLTANARSASRQYINADNSLSVPGRTVYDLGARYATSVASYPLMLRASITNVTNEAYWAMPQWTSLGLGAPRTFVLSAAVDF